MPKKKRSEGTRAPNMTSSIYQGKDGRWHGRVTMGVKDNGSPDRRHVSAKTEPEVTEKVRRLERDRDDGRTKRPGRAWTVQRWLTHWFDNIATESVRPKTLAGYRTAVYRHLIPGLGAHRLDRLQPEHVERLYSKLRGRGLKPATVHQVHRTLRTALNEARRRGHTVSNPAAIAKAPRLVEDEIEPLTVEEARRIVDVATERRNGARFALALALGLRQGEALGLQWRDLDTERGVLTVRRAIQRHVWRHGCEDPHACGGQRHKGAPCKPECKRHARACPPPCSKDCTAHARWCPKRQGGGVVTVETKSRSGRRAIGVPKPIREALENHRKAQEAERDAAGNLWHDGGWIFTQPTGKPIDPRADYAEWRSLLAAANVRPARLHDARHTAATMLLVLKVPTPAVMRIMGWSQASMASRYQHVATEILTGVAGQVERLLWAGEDNDDDDGGGAETAA